jgi:hypothetical protein
MKERPILFNAAMVRAVLDGSKTQTRRVVKPQPSYCGLEWRSDGVFSSWVDPALNMDEFSEDGGSYFRKCPYGQPGDRLWVRETWRGVVNIAPPGSYKYAVAHYIPDREHCRRVEYAASHDADGDPWRPSIHMPRWASRITLEIVSVRVERLQDISEADAKAEGIAKEPDTAHWKNYDPTARWRYWESAVQSFRTLWESVYCTESWDANPWVWVVEFKRVEAV